MADSTVAPITKAKKHHPWKRLLCETVIILLSIGSAVTWWFIFHGMPRGEVLIIAFTGTALLFGRVVMSKEIGGLAVAMIITNIVLLVGSGINALANMHLADHHATVLVCSVEHDTSGNLDQWILHGPDRLSNASYVIDPGNFMERWYSDPNRAAATVTPGTTYDITYHGGGLTGNYVTSMGRSFRSLGICGDSYADHDD